MKAHANNLRYNTRSSDDSQFWSSASDALSSVQSQIDDVVGALRQALPQPEVIQVTDPSGVLIAQIGNIVGSDNVAYPGIWARDLYIGGEGPDTAIIIANGSGVFINGASITLSDNGTLTTISNEINPWSGNAASLTSQDISSSYYAEIDPFHIALLSPTNTPIIDMATIIVSGQPFGQLTVLSPTNSVIITGNAVNSPGYSTNGHPGITLSDTFATGISVSNAPAVTGVDFTLQTVTVGSFVTSVTVSGSASHSWENGLLTS